MEFHEAFAGVHVLEICHNYVRADDPLNQAPETHQSEAQDIELQIDRQLWSDIHCEPERHWGQKIHFTGAGLSEWVARVPGLYWTPGASALREFGPAANILSEEWLRYECYHESPHVFGGIGTLRLSPATDGSRLVTLTQEMNASCGFPILVSPDVWTKITKAGNVEGRILSGTAHWQPIPHGWSERFHYTLSLPRGCLVISDPDQVEVHDAIAPMVIHPFTVMEYYAGARKLFDFVYAQADTACPGYRLSLAAFFDAYKDMNERYGRYLLGGDTIQPLWEAEFSSPADLRRADPAADSKLELLEARVQERMLGHDVVDTLLEALGEVLHTPDEVRVLSAEIGIPPGVWYSGGSVVETINQFVNAARLRSKLTALIEAVSRYYPELVLGKEW